MIVRIWRGVAQAGRVAAYREHLERRVFPRLAGLAGHRGAFLLARVAGEAEAGPGPEGEEVLVATLWDDLDALEAFAGPTPRRAVVEPEARAVLAGFDAEAAHYEVLLAAPGGLSPGG
ncbi:MAG: hypothetical protein WD341_11285 [Tistlia sp.]|uniref:hypothetical protein n=1 Tax=Tistlia sp. TaxID=3057121 RepID=UPI0034A13BF7